MIYPDNPVQATWIFASLLSLAIIFTLRKRKNRELFPVSVTQEIKGFAILVIVFAHIGYPLSADSRFLWPLSNLAGVGVNLFLFVSGYGLTISHIKHRLGILEFYTKRLKKLYAPFWLTLALFFILDLLFLQRGYSLDYIVRSFLGIFVSADVNNDIDSPLWYFTIIAFYYLIYPLLFIKKRPWISALLIYILSVYLIRYTFVNELDTAHLYRVYTTAFPLGMCAAWMHQNKYTLGKWASGATNGIRKIKLSKSISRILYGVVLISLFAVFYYSRLITSPDASPQKEQFLNIISMFILLFFFMIKRHEVKLFYIFGVYSYEIYLLHWPIMSRYDIFFKYTPAWLAVILYLVTFIILGKILQILPTKSSKLKSLLK